MAENQPRREPTIDPLYDKITRLSCMPATNQKHTHLCISVVPDEQWFSVCIWSQGVISANLLCEKMPQWHQPGKSKTRTHLTAIFFRMSSVSQYQTNFITRISSKHDSTEAEAINFNVKWTYQFHQSFNFRSAQCEAIKYLLFLFQTAVMVHGKRTKWD